MKKIVITNQKGGVGKSTTALNLGFGLINKGFKVLFIDLDQQGNLSFSLNADPQNYNLLELLTDNNKDIKDFIQHFDRFDVISSHPALAAADLKLTEIGKEYRLKEVLTSVERDYDFCIIDTPPSLGVLNINAMVVGDYAIVPCGVDFYSVQGLYFLADNIDDVRKYCKSNIKVLGLLLTRYKGNTNISKDLLPIFNDTAARFNSRVFNVKIRDNVDIAVANSKQSDIFSFNSRCNGSLDYLALTDEVLKEIGNE